MTSYLNQIFSNSDAKLQKILESLETEFDITLDFGNKQSLDDLETVASSVVVEIKENSNGQDLLKDARSTAALLVLEAIKLYRESNMNLNESSEIDKAELLLASKNVVDELQGLIQDVSKIQVQKLPPIVDKMKLEFGMVDASNYRDQTNTAIQAVLDALAVAKETIDNVTNELSGDVDMAADTGSLDAPEEVSEEPADDDLFGDDSGELPIQTRERKDESVKNTKKVIKESKKFKVSAIGVDEKEIVTEEVEALNFGDAIKQCKEKWKTNTKINADTEFNATPVMEDVVPFPSHKVKPAIPQAKPASVHSYMDAKDDHDMHTSLSRQTEIQQEVYKDVIKPAYDMGAKYLDFDAVKAYVNRKYGDELEKNGPGVENFMAELESEAFNYEAAQSYFESVENKKALLTEGIWALPRSKIEAQAVITLMKNHVTPELARQKLFQVIGSDDLYDKIDDAEQKFGNDIDVRDIIYDEIVNISSRTNTNVKADKVMKSLAAHFGGQKFMFGLMETVLIVETKKGKKGKKTFKNKKDAKKWLKENASGLKTVMIEGN